MKLAILSKPVESAVTFYRAAGVFGPLARANPEIQIVYVEPKKFTPDFAASVDVVFAHRPVSGDEFRALWTASRTNVQIWVDIDDLLWGIPPSNPAAAHFTDEHMRVLSECLKNSSLVSCSTKYLAERLQKDMGRKALVIPNAWNDYTQKLAPANVPVPSKSLKVLWRGSNTHDGDLFEYRDAFKPIDGLEFHFMGAQPWYMLESYGGHLPAIYMDTWTGNILEYFERLVVNAPHFMVVPLQNNEFNQAKSNIAQIEALVCGALPICPNSAVFQEFFYISENLSFTDPAQLYAVFYSWVTQSSVIYSELHSQAVKYMEENLRLSKINELRYQALKMLTQ